MMPPEFAMFDSLVENAVDFLKVSLEELKGRPKYSVITFCSGVEIFFKARLMAEHWSLVVAKPEMATSSKFKEGDFISVTLDQAIDRLENVANERFPPHVKETFKQLQKHRNKLVHFFHKGYTNGANDKIINEIVSEQCRAWLYLHKLLTSQWKRQFKKFRRKIEKLDALMHEHREFLQVKYESLESKINKIIKCGGSIATCFACGFASARTMEDTPPIKEYKCMVCGTTDRHLYIPCPGCGKNQVYSGEGDIQCADCGRNITVDDIIEMYTPEKKICGPRETAMENKAYCHYCDYPNPSVVQLSDKWVCLACLEPHKTPGYCDWCGEFITGNLEGSGYFGCPHCDGKRDS